MAIHPQTSHDHDKSNAMTLWVTVAVLVVAVLIYILMTGAWSTHSAATGADPDAQRTAVNRTTADGQPATGGTPKGDLPRP
jgi:cell division protein FtsX